MFKHAILFMLILVSANNINAQSITPEQANEYFVAQNWEQVIASYESLVKENPQQKSYWYRLGLGYHSVNKYDEAIKAYTEATKIGAIAPAIRYNLACSYARNNQVEKAMEQLEIAINNGFFQLQTLETDTDLDNLRAEPKFATLHEQLKMTRYPCKYDVNYRKFDFWVGNWDVFVGERFVGENLIELVSNDCALLENWTSSFGGVGKSLNYYNPHDQKWKQTWIASGTVTEYTEIDSREGYLQFMAETPNQNGGITLTKLTFTKLENGDVRQLFEISTDDGKTWTPTFDGIYSKKITD